MGVKKKKMGSVKIYILHGWTYSLEKWEVFASLLKKSGIEPVFLKVPGLTEKSSEVWDLAKYIEWLNGKISIKAVILGHSNGGRIALAFAHKYPEKVRKLILVDSAGIYHKEPALQIKRFVFGSIAKIGKRLTNSPVLKKLLYRLAREGDYAAATPQMKQSMVNLISADLTPVLPEIRVPTLIIWGEEDRVTPVSDAHIFNRLIAGSELKILRGARHSPFYTHPQEVLETIKHGI